MLVVMLNYGQASAETFNMFKYCDTEFRMFSYSYPLIAYQRSGLEKNVIRDTNLADVVKHCCCLKLGYPLRRITELLSDAYSIFAGFFGVPISVVVFGINRSSQSMNGFNYFLLTGIIKSHGRHYRGSQGYPIPSRTLAPV